jgi:2-hydroxy-3-keto-5-methylthiopentenyl-1-phosphate phosphatase
MQHLFPPLAHPSPAYPPGGPAIISDFDGTIVPINTLNYLLEHFAAPEWRDITQSWARGELSQEDEYRLGFASVRASPEEMLPLLSKVPVDPGFPGFIDLCRQRGVPFAIVSDGLRWYIETILKNHGLHDISIYACEVHFLNPGYSFEFPFFHPSTPLNGASKRRVVQEYSRHYQPVIFIGDGHNDFKAAEVAGSVYARDRLLEIASQRGLPVSPFASFADIACDLFADGSERR